MGLFSPDLNGMGPGGTPEPAEKRGIARFIEIISRDIFSLLASGALAMASCLVYAVGMKISIDSHALLIMLIAGPVGGMIAAPQLCGMADTILRALRDEAGFWWMRYRAAWLRNLKPALLTGFFGGLLFGFQYFMLEHIGRMDVSPLMVILMLAGVALATAIASWILPQLVLMELPAFNLLMNSVLLCIRYPLRTLLITALQLAYWLFLKFAFPYSIILFVLLNFWLPMLVTLMIIYQPLEDTFHIKETLENDNADAALE